jgi:hypothetical protein
MYRSAIIDISIRRQLIKVKYFSFSAYEKQVSTKSADLPNIVCIITGILKFVILKWHDWGFFDMTGLEIVFKGFCTIGCRSKLISCVQNFRSIAHTVFPN